MSIIANRSQFLKQFFFLIRDDSSTVKISDLQCCGDRLTLLSGCLRAHAISACVSGWPPTKAGVRMYKGGDRGVNPLPKHPLPPLLPTCRAGLHPSVPYPTVHAGLRTDSVLCSTCAYVLSVSIPHLIFHMHVYSGPPSPIYMVYIINVLLDV